MASMTTSQFGTGSADKLLNGDDIAPLDHDPPVFYDAARSVHREHEPMLNRDARHPVHPSLTAAPQNSSREGARSNEESPHRYLHAGPTPLHFQIATVPGNPSGEGCRRS